MSADVFQFPKRRYRGDRPQAPPKVVRPQPSSWGEPLVPKTAAHWRMLWHEEVLKRWDLGRAAIAIAGVLMHHYRVERGYVEIGFRRLADESGCSVGTAVAAVAKMRKAGLLAVLNEGAKVKGTKAVEVHRYALIYQSRGISQGGPE
jgi:hypothetical protein